MDAAERARKVAHQMQIVEGQDRIVLHALGGQRFGRCGAEDEVRHQVDGVSLARNCDHLAGKIGRKIVPDIACEPKRRCPRAATEFQHAVIGQKQRAGTVERALISGRVRDRRLGVSPRRPVPETRVTRRAHAACPPDRDQISSARSRPEPRRSRDSGYRATVNKWRRSDGQSTEAPSR
ncbi:hypothetical protein D9M72_502580 [compost metagenome]